MKIFYLAFIPFLIILFSLSFVSPSFVCGVVDDSKDISSDWSRVVVYFEENKSDLTECRVNPEKKFCCDLENISSVNFSVGKKVFAEVFDLEKGIIGGPVYLFLTDKGYDIFPDMAIKEMVNSSLQKERIFLDKSYINLNIDNPQSPKELNYILSSSEGEFKGKLQDNSNISDFKIPIQKGKNQLIIYSEKTNEVYNQFSFYNLDYFNFNIEPFCKNCKKKKNFFYIDSKQIVTLMFGFNSSHNVSGDFLISFPRDWELINYSDIFDISLSHKAIKNIISDKKEFYVNYSFKLPKNTIKQDYFVYQQLGDYNSSNKLRSFKYNWIPFHKSNKMQESYQNNVLRKSISPKYPAVLNLEYDFIKTIALFPNKDIPESYSTLKYSEKIKKGRKTIFFEIFTTIQEKDLENIFIVFKVEKGKNITLSDSEKELELDFMNEDANYEYYSVYTTNKGPFNILIY